MAWLGVTFVMALFVFPALIRAFARLSLVVLLIATCMAASHHDIMPALILAMATGLIVVLGGFRFRRASA